MKKLLFIPLLFISSLAFAVPSTTLSITPTAVDATVIQASDVNTRNSAISTWANAHDHTDIVVDEIRDADNNTKIQTEEAANENIIRMDTNGVERWIMTAAGERTMPTQPAFLVQPAIGQDNVATGSQIDIVFGTEIVDQSSDFASNTFTAPVTGRYQINASILMASVDTAATGYGIRIVTSNRSYESSFTPLFSGDLTWFVNVGVLADMDASDTAKITFEQTAGAAQTDISTSSFFSGFLAL